MIQVQRQATAVAAAAVAVHRACYNNILMVCGRLLLSPSSVILTILDSCEPAWAVSK